MSENTTAFAEKYAKIRSEIAKEMIEEFNKKYQELVAQQDSLPRNILERRQKEVQDMYQRQQQFQRIFPRIRFGGGQVFLDAFLAEEIRLGSTSGSVNASTVTKRLSASISETVSRAWMESMACARATETTSNSNNMRMMCFMDVKD